MAKKSMVNREVKRAKLVKQHAAKRAALKAVIYDQTKPIEERFKATQKLATLPRNSSAVRIHNRCQLTGRPHAFYRKLKLSAGSCCASWPRSARSPAWSSRAGKGGKTMSMNDPLGDMLTRIRNAQLRGKSVVVDARVEAARPRAGSAAVRRLHPRLRKEVDRQRPGRSKSA
jgi:small subunit ribosomal protein S14